MSSEKYVLGLDVGTTTVRAIVYDPKGQIRGQARDEVKLIEVAEEGKVEIEPDQLWASVQKVLREAIQGTRSSITFLFPFARKQLVYW